MDGSEGTTYYTFPLRPIVKRTGNADQVDPRSTVRIGMIKTP